MNAALQRYRITAWVVGTGLLILVFVAMPVKYLGHNRSLVEIVGPLHGFLFIVYLLFALELAIRNRWPLLRTGLVMLAGTVPFLSFVAERQVTRWVRTEQRSPARSGTAHQL